LQADLISSPANISSIEVNLLMNSKTWKYKPPEIKTGPQLRPLLFMTDYFSSVTVFINPNEKSTMEPA